MAKTTLNRKTVRLRIQPADNVDDGRIDHIIVKPGQAFVFLGLEMRVVYQCFYVCK
jgi:hypothetical protein